MEILLTNSLFFLYLLGALAIFNYGAFDKRQKIAIIYVCSYGMAFNSAIRCYKVTILLVFVLFLYEEYLNQDLAKIKYISNIGHKVLDYMYMYVFQYKILYIIVAIFIQSHVGMRYIYNLVQINEQISGMAKTVIVAGSLLLLYIGIHKIFVNPVEFRTFKRMEMSLRKHPYYSLPWKDEVQREKLCEKLKLVADIEDYTFFQRKRSYSAFSVEFLKIVWEKKYGQWLVKQDYTKKNKCICGNITKRLTWNNIRKLLSKKRKRVLFNSLKIVYQKMCCFICVRIQKIKKKFKGYFRGYSTIEMQLIRILAYQKGLYFNPKNNSERYQVLIRKVFEVIYAHIFFLGYKKNLHITKDKDYYRYYLVYSYLHTVQTNLNGYKFDPLDKIFGKVDVIDWPKEALFIIVLGLNGLSITMDRVDAYTNIINKYQLNRDTLEKLVKCIS